MLSNAKVPASLCLKLISATQTVSNWLSNFDHVPSPSGDYTRKERFCWSI